MGIFFRRPFSENLPIPLHPNEFTTFVVYFAAHTHNQWPGPSIQLYTPSFPNPLSSSFQKQCVMALGAATEKLPYSEDPLHLSENKTSKPQRFVCALASYAQETGTYVSVQEPRYICLCTGTYVHKVCASLSTVIWNNSPQGSCK